MKHYTQAQKDQTKSNKVLIASNKHKMQFQINSQC